MVTEPDHPFRGGGPALADLSGPFLVALLSGDEREVEELFGRAAARGADVAIVSRDLIEPAFEEIGRMWCSGPVSTAEEHLATAIVIRAVTRQAASIPSPPLGAPCLLLSCLAGEFHELGIRIVSEVARAAGWQAEVLGANAPREAAIRLIALHRPDAVGLSLALPTHLVECARTIEEVRKAAPRAKVLVGGRAFRHDEALPGLVGADACFRDCVALRDWLLANRPCRPAEEAPRADEARANVAEALRKRTRR